MLVRASVTAARISAVSARDLDLLARQVSGAEELRAFFELRGRSPVANLAAFQHVGALRDAERDVDELLDQQHAGALVGDGLDGGNEAPHDNGREPEGELVDEE